MKTEESTLSKQPSQQSLCFQSIFSSKIHSLNCGENSILYYDDDHDMFALTDYKYIINTNTKTNVFTVCGFPDFLFFLSLVKNVSLVVTKES